MSSRARSPSVESVPEISRHLNDDIYGNLDFPVAGVQIRSPRAIRSSPACSRQHGLFSRSLSTSSDRAFPEYRCSRDRSPLKRPSSVEHDGQFREQGRYYDGRYSNDRYFDVDRQDYRGESGPCRWAGYLARRFSPGNHEFNDRQWGHEDYSYNRFRLKEEWGRNEAFWRNQSWHRDRFHPPGLRYDLDWRLGTTS